MSKLGLIILLLISIDLSLPICHSAETNFTIKPEDLYKQQLKQGRPTKDLEGERKESEETGAGATAGKMMRARGVYGGASDMRRGHSKNDATSLRIKSIPSSFWEVLCVVVVVTATGLF
ncbi:uncharacterized protein LOC111007432 [Momordica charantia]|uniref:Uncharacterized protein LOC111007432 n=1 Tax=Momordica charantia TaxID=3673 RepID=A0A6J1C4Y5_MOMCH|nr:uncharacterized protein LOC111007432 [Momordica charantia]